VFAFSDHCLGTPPSLTCYTPTFVSTPPKTQGTSRSSSVATPLVPSARPVPCEQVSGGPRLPDQVQFCPGIIEGSQLPSWWSPGSYLRLRGFEDTESQDSEVVQEVLQRTVYRLCALASATRERMISGEPRQNVDLIDQILALGLEDSKFPNLIPQSSQNSLMAHTITCDYDRYIMAPFLQKIYKLLDAAQGLKFIDQTPGM
jgi:hypothetical protein